MHTKVPIAARLTLDNLGCILELVLIQFGYAVFFKPEPGASLE